MVANQLVKFRFVKGAVETEKTYLFRNMTKAQVLERIPNEFTIETLMNMSFCHVDYVVEDLK